MEPGNWPVIEGVYNWIEVGLWAFIGIVLAVRALRHHGRRRRLLLLAAGAFLLFSWSDYHEIGTGAWWEPWWLAAMKVACVATVLGSWLYWRRRFPSAEPTPKDC